MEGVKVRVAVMEVVGVEVRVELGCGVGVPEGAGRRVWVGCMIGAVGMAIWGNLPVGVPEQDTSRKVIMIRPN